MINIINDNFNDSAKDYYKLQEENERLKKIIEKVAEDLELVLLYEYRYKKDDKFYVDLDIDDIKYWLNILKGGEESDN